MQNYCSPMQPGLEGCEAATARSAGAGAIAESRKARFFCRPVDGKKMRTNSSSEKFLTPQSSLDLFKNLSVPSQVTRNLTQMAANSNIFREKLFRN
jgi:hypothetical protein